ncbi:MAG: 3-deoxy-manno-octulosonate cytidylyltransferase [Omnitrophica WOR_2 bacterium RIFCSPLOWO2_12_FULL_50_9]|nr:MAG: 3-deoxy-manno-octulosonate cytidylyltransferase [Omnitrophica WOR_2 bacterium RIFCSPHIGHO2_02_FULL_50_17]OGX43526.1 MAG: 3-deoxy-manno-octulosonate cytidylyltransferase [Omnitrophica WOR_2 bacterium RIFCSPLOWO2_12_FULL_50_9]
MRIVGVIPARWASTRFKGKVLAKIQDRPMIQHVWERAKESRLLDEVLIACDDERVLQAAQAFGAKAVLTSPDHPSGTDRVAEAVKNCPAKIVINIQGDEPLIRHQVIDDLAEALIEDEACLMATVIKAIETQEELENPNVVKVVIDREKNAIYFSRLPIPYDREKAGTGTIRYYKHLGIYAYRKDFLMALTQMPKSLLERAEQLEQLRALEAGVRIKTILTDMETIGVDTPEDLARVEGLLQ